VQHARHVHHVHHVRGGRVCRGVAERPASPGAAAAWRGVSHHAPLTLGRLHADGLEQLRVAQRQLHELPAHAHAAQRVCVAGVARGASAWRMRCRPQGARREARRSRTRPRGRT
jgi:hypothetical protein